MHRAALAIREQLDSMSVLRAAVDLVEATLPGTSASFWLTRGPTPPRLAYPDPAPHAAAEAPREAFIAVRRRRPVADARNGIFVAPVIAPRSGLLGVIVVEQVPDGRDDDGVIVDIADEAGFALETTNLYEQALAEKERSEAILSRVADAVVVTDPGGHVQQFNRSAVDILALNPRTVASRHCTTVLGLRMGDQPLECATGCALLQIAAESSALGVEVGRTLPDGRIQPLLANASVVSDPEGTVTEVVHSFRDISKLKEADEAKTMFLATASHELKTPLTVIRGFSEMLMVDGMKDEEQHQAKEAIARRSVELNRIVDRILLSSRIEAGRVEVVAREIDLTPIVNERVGSFGLATGREIVGEIDPEASHALADPEAFATVLDHLIDNAIKYSPDGGSIVVAVTTRERDVAVGVRDHGIGMTAEQAARCFEKFFQGESSDVRRFGGTGIGLYIVRSLIEAMGGSVEVTSEPGDGSTFLLLLRRADIDASPERTHHELPAAPERSMVREFMRQIGVPTAGGPR